MDDCQKEFLWILKDYIHKTKGTYHLSAEILSYAKSQEVEGIIYFQTNAPDLKSKYLMTILYSENLKHLMNIMNNKLSSFPHFFVKGFTLADYYPNCELRTMGDVDLVVREKDLNIISNIMRDNGFVIQPQVESVIVAIKDKYKFEIHTSLIHSGIGNEKAKNYFLHCWDYVNNNTIDKNYHFIFIIQHLKGHLISHSVGFRQFMDIALFSKDKDLDWTWIKKELEKIDLLEFTKIVFSFIELWFEVESPIENNKIDSSFFEIATNKIFCGGVFGQYDESNKNTGIVKHAINNGENLVNAKYQYFWNELFPEYKIMCTLPYCKYVNKSKTLLPVAWLHRLFYRGFNQKYRIGFIKRTTIDHSAQERMKLLQKWGL